MADPVLRRRAARVILLDESDRVLMLHGFDPHTPEVSYWYTLGGGIAEGEDAKAAACREVWEETGLRLRPEDLRGPVGEEEVVFPFDGWVIEQHHVFFGARTPRFEPSRLAWEETEVRSTLAFGWLDPHALDVVAEPVYPPTLADLVQAVRALL